MATVLLDEDEARARGSAPVRGAAQHARRADRQRRPGSRASASTRPSSRRASRCRGPPVREALKALIATGLLEVKGRQGVTAVQFETLVLLQEQLQNFSHVLTRDALSKELPSGDCMVPRQERPSCDRR